MVIAEQPKRGSQETRNRLLQPLQQEALGWHPEYPSQGLLPTSSQHRVLGGEAQLMHQICVRAPDSRNTSVDVLNTGLKLLNPSVDQALRKVLKTFTKI